ncbi:hypothetical protein AVEN_140611-1 [Araneus ventricosus]|uniref:Fibrinogen C-terminal domain-containing protein n=1 Tax=Araneus ventricosus TaxID=182803 RepID=A0A4Y2UX78_ARAVE|nr:hypothetical protein AVEN_140611-1 [Araneus ventricosus]
MFPNQFQLVQIAQTMITIDSWILLMNSASEEDENSKNGSECAGQKSLAYIEISKKMISDVRKNFPTCSKPIEKDDKIVQDDKPRDCSEILARGRNKSGVHTIWAGEPFPAVKPLQVYCDMQTDKGGWTDLKDGLTRTDERPLAVEEGAPEDALCYDVMCCVRRLLYLISAPV